MSMPKRPRRREAGSANSQQTLDYILRMLCPRDLLQAIRRSRVPNA